MKYNPCSKKFQEEAKKLGLDGYQYYKKLVKEGKLSNPTDVDKKTNNKIYQNAGYKGGKNEYMATWRHANGINQSMLTDRSCSNHLGIVVAERFYGRKILPIIFGEIKKEMPWGNPGYDFIVTGDLKVDVKSCSLRYLKGWIGWEPHVNSTIADVFVMLLFKDRINMDLEHILSIGKNEQIRGCEFYDRESIKITNSRRGLLEFKKYDLIDKLRDLTYEIRDAYLIAMEDPDVHLKEYGNKDPVV